MFIHFTCPFCGKQGSVDESYAGRKVKCKACGRFFFASMLPGLPAGVSSGHPFALKLARVYQALGKLLSLRQKELSLGEKVDKIQNGRIFMSYDSTSRDHGRFTAKHDLALDTLKKCSRIEIKGLTEDERSIFDDLVKAGFARKKRLAYVYRPLKEPGDLVNDPVIAKQDISDRQREARDAGPSEKFFLNKRTMNRNQRYVLLVAAAVVAAMVLFPPYSITSVGAPHLPLGTEYGFLFSPPQTATIPATELTKTEKDGRTFQRTSKTDTDTFRASATVSVGTLAVQIAGTLVVACLLCLAMQAKPSRRLAAQSARNRNLKKGE